MPNPTTNYSWTMPTEGGSTGTWDTILNTFIEDLDTDLKTVERSQYIGEFFEVARSHADNELWLCGHSGADELPTTVTTVGVNVDLRPLMIPFPMLRAGMKITGFSTLGYIEPGDAAQASLVYMDETGAMTTVSAGHALTATLGRDQTTALTHAVVAGRYYYVKIKPSIAATGVSVWGASVTVTYNA